MGVNRMMYSGLCREFASHGMLVIAIDHLDGSCDYTIKSQTCGTRSTGREQMFNDKKDHFDFAYRNKQVGIRAVEMS